MSLLLLLLFVLLRGTRRGGIDYITGVVGLVAVGESEVGKGQCMGVGKVGAGQSAGGR